MVDDNTQQHQQKSQALKKSKRLDEIKKKSKHVKHKVEDLAKPEVRAKLRAIAVKYDTKKGKAPKIIATGKGRVAEKILHLAEENEIPFYEDRELTELLGKLDLDMEIPPQLYSMVAEVLAVVYQLNRKAKAKIILNAAKEKEQVDKKE